VLISFSAVFVRLAAVEPLRSAFLRGAYALPVLWALRWWTGRGRGEQRSVLPLALVAGGLLGADLMAWHLSIGIFGAGLATVLSNLQVVFVGVAGVLVFGERPRAGFWLALPLVLGGIWLLGATGRPLVLGASAAVGVGWGVLTAVFYSGYLLLLRVARLRQPGVDAFDTMAWVTLGSTLLTGAFAAQAGVAAPAGRWPADGWLLCLALGSQVLGWVLLTSSIHRLPAALTAVTLVLQPVLALIWGVVLLGEPLGLPQGVGACLALMGVALAQASSLPGRPGGARGE